MGARGEDDGRKKGKVKKGKKHEKGGKPGDVAKPHMAFKMPRKDHTPRSSAASELPSSLLFEDDDLDFPRGGASVLSRQEESEARAEAEAEFEREEKEPRKGKERRSQRGATRQLPHNEDDLGSLFGEGVSGKLPRFANRITLKNISPRMKLWGIIVEVNDKDLVVSLPGGLRGFIRLDDVSDIPIDNEREGSESNLLSSIFHTGQLVACVVLRVDDDKKDGKTNKRIWLSLQLGLLYNGLTLDAVQDGMLLNAQVKSVEDHGYILYFGVSSFTGFLPRNEIVGTHIISGQILQCVVKNIDKLRAVVHVSSNPDLVAKCVMRDGKGLSIDLLVPGMMVNARIHSALENGLMLSFLTYFTGTVDIFNLQSFFPSGNWKDDYNQNKKVNARILFVDPSTRAVGLTLNPFLVNNKAPPAHAKTGDIYDESRIVRVDKGIGLLLELPSSPDPSPAYVSIFDASDEKVLKLEKKFKEGSHARTRILGMRNVEGLAIGTLKTSAFEGSVFTHSDVKPGMLVKAKVISLEDFGAIVQFSSGVKALCPLPHMSELDIVKPPKKFKVGAELKFRVLGCKSKRITVTHKKTLVSSKLNVLASYSDATEGLVTHGWITKIEKHGCFVRFYNGVQGFAHRTELGLDPGDEADSGYHVGQVVKCRIINSAAGPRRINVSFIIKPRSTSEGDIPKLGSVVSGIVERLTPTAVIVHLNNYDSLKGTIFNEHLADFHGQATSLRCLLKPGTEFDQLLVLDCEGKNLILSAKHSLITSVRQIPSNVNEIKPLSFIYGYICNIIETGCFVRFLRRLTGFSPKNLATDEQVDNLLDAFYIGQSVRSHILNVNNESGRIKLSLKQSLCSSSDVSLIRGFFLLEEKIAVLQMSNSNTSSFSWVKSFSIGSLVEGEIQEIKDLGLVVGFKDHPDVVGFVSNHQLGGIYVKAGSAVRAVVLDVVKSDSLVDLSLKPELVNNASLQEKKKKRIRKTFADFKLHQSVNAVVEIVKENYLVLTVPEYNYAIGFASLTDYNIQNLPNKPFTNGQSVTATVGAVPSPESSGRLLLLPSTSTYKSEISNKKAKRTSNNTLGSLVEVEVVDLKPLEVVVKSCSGFHGRIHITEVFDDAQSVENPFAEFSIGQLLNARIVAKGGRSGKSSKGYDWELSVRPSVVAGNMQTISPTLDDDFTFSVGSIVNGYVVKVDNEWVWLTVSRSVMAHMYILDTSCEPSELKEFKQQYYVGKFVKGRIVSVNKEKKLVRMTSYLPPPLLSREIDDGGHQENGTSHVNIAENISQGDIVGGRVKKILPGVGGILVQIGPHLFGRAHYTELVDEWISNPLSKYEEGQFVKCKILEVARSIEGNVHVDLSLRSSLCRAQNLSTALVASSKRVEKVDCLSPGIHLQGYVKSISSKGCFVMLSRVVDARILLSNLSDGFIENPEKEFPVGKLIDGRILSVEPSSKRVELTLRKAEETGTKCGVAYKLDLHVGEIISGQIRRVESYGLFIGIDKTDMVGLCHISEISDEHVDNIQAKFRTGVKVLAKILKIDEGRKRISLGMKRSYFGHESDVLITSSQGLDDDLSGGDRPVDHKILSLHPNDNLCSDDMMVECNNGVSFDKILPQIERRALVPPLQVSFDDSELSDVDKVEVSNKDNMGNDELVRKGDRPMKKRAKEDKEFEINASEQRLLENDTPVTVDDFERQLKSSPNSSFMWIKYMAHMLSLADVEKARSIAERALKTINFREEGEKHNIWVAYFNLENEFGNPPKEAVKKIFQRALQYCDSKKIHLSLLGVYERTEQYNLASELLDRMTKKFNISCKVWVHCVQNWLKQQKDGIQSVINRALLSLPHKKHIKFLSKTAILEFKCGIPDRGRSMFESILREYPKRTDLWSIYLDQEIHMGDEEVIRALFERATCLSLPPKKMKFLLKKYLEYESAHGDEARIEYVKKKALEYVESF